jgi:phage tail sheath protein FI
MSDYLSPGVYIQELEGPAPITGVSTSIAAFVGMAERGPVNIPILCTGLGDYTRWFGGLLNKDQFADIADPDRAHCYLPYAVAGFFANAGQVAYVTRVVPRGAVYATELLFDRARLAGAPASTLVRGAAQGDGAAGANPLLMLAPAPPASTALVPSWIRIGDGSAAEYGQVETVTTVTDAYPLDMPLRNFHAAGANFAIYARSPLGGNFILAADAPAGATILLLQTNSGAVTAAQLLASVLEIATESAALVVIPATVSQTNATNFTVTLTNPLPTSISAVPGAALVTPLTPTTPAPATNVLTESATGGDLLVLATGAGFALGDLIDIDQNNTTSPSLREIRTIASSLAAINDLTMLSFTQPNTVEWPAGTLITPVTETTNSFSAVNGNAITLASLAGIIPGSVLLLGGAEYVTVASINAATSQAVLTAAPASAAPGAALLISTSILSAAAPAGSRQLVLSGRAGIAPGALLQLGAAQEYAVVQSVPGIRALGADPGILVLDAPLAAAYPVGAAAAIRALATTAAAPPVAGVARATSLVLAMPAGAASGFVTWSAGWTAGQLLLVTLPDGTVFYNSLSVPAVAQKLDAITLAAPVQGAHPAGGSIVSRSPLIQVQALDQGSWGNRLAIAVQDETPGLAAAAPITASLAGGTQLKLATLTGIQPGSYLEMVFAAAGALVDATAPIKVAAVNIATATITLDAPISAAQLSAVGNIATNPVSLRSREFRLTAYLLQQPSAAVPSRNSQIIQSETFRNLSMDPRHNQYFQTIIGAINGPPRLSDNRPAGSSWLIRVLDDAATPTAAQAPRLGPEALIDILSNGLQRPAQHNLQNGDDGIGSVSDQTYIGTDSNDPASRTGLYSLLNVPQISIVAIPGQGTPTIQAALIAHCENALYRFAILDPQYPDAAIADIQAQRQQFDSKFAALYYPWLTIEDPFPQNLNNILDFPLPPSGHMAGIYARVDDARGVFKAPANEVVQGITGLTATLAKGDQDVLNPFPTNINVIRDFRAAGRGIRVWGARIITSDANYTYVPVKRLMMFIEESLDIGLQDIVFEPNAPPLWASVERLIGNFLTTLWAAGGLQGNTAEDSFFVRCDLTTMSQTDIDAGRLIAQVGVAPVYPAEFVIIQISLTIPATSN